MPTEDAMLSGGVGGVPRDEIAFACSKIVFFRKEARTFFGSPERSSDMIWSSELAEGNVGRLQFQQGLPNRPSYCARPLSVRDLVKKGRTALLPLNGFDKHGSVFPIPNIAH